MPRVSVAVSYGPLLDVGSVGGAVWQRQSPPAQQVPVSTSLPFALAGPPLPPPRLTPVSADRPPDEVALPPDEVALPPDEVARPPDDVALPPLLFGTATNGGAAVAAVPPVSAVVAPLP